MFAHPRPVVVLVFFANTGFFFQFLRIFGFSIFKRISLIYVSKIIIPCKLQGALGARRPTGRGRRPVWRRHACTEAAPAPSFDELATCLVPYTHLHCARARALPLSPGRHRSRAAFRSRGGGPRSGGDAAAPPYAPTRRQRRRQRQRWRQWQRQRQSRRGAALVHAKRQLPRCLLQRPCRLRCA